jgi:hypothetical protein
MGGNRAEPEDIDSERRQVAARMAHVAERLQGLGYTPEGIHALTGVRVRTRIGDQPVPFPPPPPPPPWSPALPIQATVDRPAPLQPTMVDTPVMDDQGNVLLLLRNPVGGPYGPMPADPAWFRRRT